MKPSNNRNEIMCRLFFFQHGHEIRIAGGAVRDLVSGKSAGLNDIDLATTATPEEMIQMFATERVRTINEQGKVRSIKKGVFRPSLDCRATVLQG